MILRDSRHPRGIDLGPRTGVPRATTTRRAIGAVLLPDAIAPDVSETYRKHAGGKPKRTPVDRAAGVRAHWASLTPEERAERGRKQAEVQRARYAERKG